MKIFICKFCNGSGKINTSIFVPAIKICPICGGSGEFELDVDPDRIIQCKFCSESGKLSNSVFPFDVKPCPACKGLGVTVRARVSIKNISNEISSARVVPRPTSFKYDIAVSFAGEDGGIVEQYVDKLKIHKLTIFYDSFEKANLWGKDLYEQLDNIYRKQARYCVVFLSTHYATKLWTNHERKSAQARAFQENSEYILPIRLDDTEIPGIRDTVSYIDLRKTSLDELVNITLVKLRKK